MDFRTGDREFSERQWYLAAQRHVARYNIDYKGWLSTGLLIFAYGVLFVAIALFTFYWWHLANEDGQTRKAIDALGLSTAGLKSLAASLERKRSSHDDAHERVTFPSEFADKGVFTIFSEVDATKRLQFDLSQLPHATTLTLHSQRRSGVVAYIDDLRDYPATFPETEFVISHAEDRTKVLMFDLALVSAATTHVLTIPDESGVIALLADMPDPTSTLKDAEFAVQDGVDSSKELAFDLSLLNPGSSVILAVTDASGTVALRSDLPPSNATFSETEFVVFHDKDDSATVRFDVSSLVSSRSVSTLTVQANPPTGTIAYTDQVAFYVDVVINESRSFPDPAFENANTLLELGVTQVQLWGCGAGGGGGGAYGSSTSGGGGGSGSAFEKFLVDDVSQLFTTFDCIVGQGGAGGIGSTTTPTAGKDGGTTSIIGVPTTTKNGFLELMAYGGGGGQVSGLGGAGAGSGGAAMGAAAGGAGNEGGLAGGGPGKSGGFRYPWHAGSGGGQSLIDDAAPWHGGGDAGANGGVMGGGGGAGGLFGTGGDGGVSFNGDGAVGGICAGGGGAAFTDSRNSGGDGGNGQIIIRYWII